MLNGDDTNTGKSKRKFDMDQGTAEAISVMERQMAEKDQKIAALNQAILNMRAESNQVTAGILVRLGVLEHAADAFVKGLGK
jgi:hypothetical protein